MSIQLLLRRPTGEKKEHSFKKAGGKRLTESGKVENAPSWGQSEPHDERGRPCTGKKPFSENPWPKINSVRKLRFEKRKDLHREEKWGAGI